MKFKEMSLKKKIGYLWDYYKVHIFVLLFVGYFVISLVMHFLTHKEPLLSVLMLNCMAEENEISEIFDDFLEFSDSENDEGAIEINSNLYIAEDITNAKEYESSQILWALVAAGEYDVFIGTGDIFLDYANRGAFVDLSAIIEKELYDQYGEYLIYSFNEEETYPCAIQLKNNQCVKQMGYAEGCYIAVLHGGEHQEMAAKFLEYILSYL